MSSNPKVTGNELEKFVEDAEALDMDTDVAGQQRANREKQLARWNEQEARRTAEQLGLELTDGHLAVVKVLRDHYLEHGTAEDGRALETLLTETFADRGGKNYLHQLFPGGPVNQGLRIADLPIPPHTVDSGFGTAR